MSKSWLELGIESAYFINLDSRTDRLERITSRLGSLGLEAVRFSAHPASESIQIVSDFPVLSSAAQLACLYSHLSLWRELLRTRREDIFLILEDDCHLASGVPEAFDLVMLPAQWELLQLGSSHPASLVRGFSFWKRGILAARWEAPGWGTFAYLVKRSLMERLVRQYLPYGQTLSVVGVHRPDKVASDGLLCYASKSYSLCMPLATTSNPLGESDIGYGDQTNRMVADARDLVLKMWDTCGLT